MKLVKFVVGGICSCLVVSFCTPEPARNGGVSGKAHCPPVSEHISDTLGYTISFPDEVRRSEFMESFRSFLDHYSFAELTSDTASGQVTIRLAPSSGNPGGSRSPGQPVVFSGDNASPWDETEHSAGSGAVSQNNETQPQPVVAADTVEPVFGGTLRIFSQRGGIDEPFLPLVAADLLSGDGTVPGLTVASVSPKKLSLQISGRLTDGTGRLLSALDIIDAWTAYIKKHPAEGVALFRHVEGIREFIAGKEAVVRGFGAADQKTVYMRFSEADTLALLRIKTGRLCAGGYLKLGQYLADKSTDGNVLLLPNQKSGPRRANCDTVKMIGAEDRNPILSFSLKKYDAVPLASLADLTYARSTLDKQAALWPFARDRYFLSCATNDEAVRSYLASRVNAAELLRNVVKTEGAPVSALESVNPPDGSAAVPVPAAGKIAAPVGRTVRIVYRKDDPVSCAIAEKILADLSGSGVRGILAGAAATEYERALVDRNYDCAVGWVAESILSDTADKLRLASIWFADVSSEAERIATRREIPLFSVDRYLLMRRPAGLHRGAVAGIYASSRPVSAK